MKYDYEQLAIELKEKGIHHERVLEAIAKTPRHLFISENIQTYATEDTSLPIDCEQTISQPYVVAIMTEAILGTHQKLKKVLEIGTGSGYQAAILSHLAEKVYTVERIEVLHQKSKKIFQKLCLKNIQTQFSDGNLGWEEHAPYDAILVTAATTEIPEALLSQLKVGGILVIPIGPSSIRANQILTTITRRKDGYIRKELEPVVFVPLLSGTR